MLSHVPRHIAALFGPLFGARPLRVTHMHDVSKHSGGVLLVLLAGMLVGCGGATSGDGMVPTTTAVADGCPGQASAGMEAAAPVLVLTLKDAGHENTAHKGEMIGVRLPATQRWSVAKGGDGVLEVVQPAGYWDVKANVCVWNFRAVKTGATTVGFAGRANCEPGQMCPAYVVAEEFPVTVA